MSAPRLSFRAGDEWSHLVCILLLIQVGVDSRIPVPSLASIARHVGTADGTGGAFSLAISPRPFLLAELTRIRHSRFSKCWLRFNCRLLWGEQTLCPSIARCTCKIGLRNLELYGGKCQGVDNKYC